MKLLFFDTETTGLPNRQKEGCGETHNKNGQPKIIQIGWILADGDDMLQEDSYLIRPEGFRIPPETEYYNGITTERALSKGYPIETILGKFVWDAAQADAFVGHNVGFDINVLTAELERFKFNHVAETIASKKRFDTMLSSVNYCAIPFPEGHHRGYNPSQEYKYPTLTELHEKLFGCEFEGAHDALADIRATRKCFTELVRLGIIKIKY